MVNKIDDTKEAGQENNANRQALLHSIGVMVLKDRLKDVKKDGDFETYGTVTLRGFLENETRLKISKRFKYLDQAVLGTATFFVIDRNLMMGAGHAMWNTEDQDVEDLADWCIVFDWWAGQAEGKEWRSPKKILGRNVYDIARIKILTLPTESEYAERYGTSDFTIIELTREVEAHRLSFEFAEQIPQRRSQCWAAGYPWGVPLKVSKGEIVKAPPIPQESKEAFDYSHTMILRGGNSGCPVLDMNNQVVAICSKGFADYKYSDYQEEIEPDIRTDGKTLDSLMRTDSIRWLLRPDARVRVIVHFVGNNPTSKVPVELAYFQEPSHYEPVGTQHVSEPSFISFDCALNGRRPLDIARLRIRVLKNLANNKETAVSLHVSSLRMIVSNPNNDDERFEAWYNYREKKPATAIDVKSGGKAYFSLRDVQKDASVLVSPIWTTHTFPAGRYGRDSRLRGGNQWPAP